MLGSVQDAEDIVQGLFVDLLRKGTTDVDLPYLYRASTNRCLNYLRDRRRRSRILETRSLTEDHRHRVDEPHVGRDLLDKLVDVLDGKSREILIYRFFDDMTQDEIADLTGYSRKTIGKKLGLIRQAVCELTNAEPSALQEGARP